MKNSITIDGKEVELPQALIDQIKSQLVEKKLNWQDIFPSSGYFVREDNQIVELSGPESFYKLSERSAKKELVFRKLLAVADYLNNNWIPDWNSSNELKFYIAYSVDKKLIVQFCYFTHFGVTYFKSKELAEQAIQIFKDNGNEQELINFFE